MAHRKNAEKIPAIAVIADAHFHDIESNYHCSGITLDDHPLTLRSWTDTRSSSRVFNESKQPVMKPRWLPAIQKWPLPNTNQAF